MDCIAVEKVEVDALSAIDIKKEVKEFLYYCKTATAIAYRIDIGRPQKVEVVIVKDGYYVCCCGVWYGGDTTWLDTFSEDPEELVNVFFEGRS